MEKKLSPSMLKVVEKIREFGFIQKSEFTGIIRYGHSLEQINHKTFQALLDRKIIQPGRMLSSVSQQFKLTTSANTITPTNNGE